MESSAIDGRSSHYGRLRRWRSLDPDLGSSRPCYYALLLDTFRKWRNGRSLLQITSRVERAERYDALDPFHAISFLKEMDVNGSCAGTRRPAMRVHISDRVSLQLSYERRRVRQSNCRRRRWRGIRLLLREWIRDRVNASCRGLWNWRQIEWCRQGIRCRTTRSSDSFQALMSFWLRNQEYFRMCLQEKIQRCILFWEASMNRAKNLMVRD